VLAAAVQRRSENNGSRSSMNSAPAVEGDRNAAPCWLAVEAGERVKNLPPVFKKAGITP
jgi:hypothetical protein